MYSSFKTENIVIDNINLINDNLKLDLNFITKDLHPPVFSFKVDILQDDLNSKLTFPDIYTYDLIIDWGDNTQFTSHIKNGNISSVTSTSSVSHTYTSANQYIIKVKAKTFHLLPTIQLKDSKVIEVIDWGNIRWKSFSLTFVFTNLQTIPIEPPNLSKCTSFYGMFANTLLFNHPIINWDTSYITNMNSMFLNSAFNQNINYWNTSNVTDMKMMFYKTNFNQPIGNWDTSSVTSIRRMFYLSKFNQPIGDWDTSSVTDMSQLFFQSHFNQPIGNWDTSNVENMSFMFIRSDFNQPIGNWDTSSVTNMQNMFSYTKYFDQNIDKWDTSSVTNMYNIFLDSKIEKDKNFPTWYTP